MISFTTEEVLFSLLCGVLYGFVFSLFNELIGIFVTFIFANAKLFRSILKYENIFEKNEFLIRKKREYSSFLTATIIVLFFFGFILLSYITLDGVIRLYLLFVSFAAFYLSKITVCKMIGGVLLRLLNLLFSVFLISFRILLLPFRKIYVYINRILSKWKFILTSKRRTTLDKKTRKC